MNVALEMPVATVVLAPLVGSVPAFQAIVMFLDVELGVKVSEESDPTAVMLFTVVVDGVTDMEPPFRYVVLMLLPDASAVALDAVPVKSPTNLAPDKGEIL